MFVCRLTELYRRPLLVQKSILATAHTTTCPKVKKQASCPSGGGSQGSKGLQRAIKSGKCRLGFIPEEWFLFFHSITGVSGPYVFGITLANYLLSKEIYVMEHEYYLGLSIFVVIYLVSTRLGHDIGAALDKDVDDYVNALEKGRKDEIDQYEAIIKAGKDAQWRAEGQKQLMDAKKENVTMQLEAVYRDRFMQVYRTVRGRMDYHVKRYNAEARVHQKWMIGWILDNVRKSITPEFEKQALDQAIQDLAAAASKAK